MQIDLEAIAAMTDDRCSEVWNQISEVYEPSFSAGVKRTLANCDTPRGAIRTFATYFNGHGKDRVLRHRHKVNMRIQYDELQSTLERMFQIQPLEILRSGRHPRVVAARMLLAHVMHLRGMSYPEISYRMKNSYQHSTAITADQRFQELCKEGHLFEVWDGAKFVEMTGEAIVERLNNGTQKCTTA